MSTQQTLAGGEADEADVGMLPETFLYCPECDDFVLRSQRFDHAHNLVESKDALDTNGDGDGDGGDGDDEPERVGAWYDVTIDVNVTYRFRIPAWSEHEAKDIAKDWRLDAVPADSHVVHTEYRELDKILSNDGALPDDFDVYSGDRLVDALEVSP